MLEFVGFIFIVSIILGISFGEALGGVIWMIINGVVICGIIVFVAHLFGKAD